MATKLARLETYVEGLLSYSHMTFNQVILLRSRGSLKNLYLHFHKTYHDETWCADLGADCGE